MKKRIPTFLSGALAAALVFSLGLSALAVSGQVSFGGVDVALLGKQVLAADGTTTASNGQEIPSSMTYTDGAGGGTVYLPMRRIAELLDAAIDYDATSKTIYIGGVPKDAGDIDITAPDGNTVGAGPAAGQAIPTYIISDGTNMGPFGLAEAKQPENGEGSQTLLDQARFQSTSDFDWSFHCRPASGKYVSITVTNNDASSDEELILNLFHDKTVGPKECVPAVYIKPGETVTCTFEVGDGATELNCDLGMDLTFATAAPYTMDATISAVQFG